VNFLFSVNFFPTALRITVSTVALVCCSYCNTDALLAFIDDDDEDDDDDDDEATNVQE